MASAEFVNMSQRAESDKDLRGALGDLTKIPAKEFEKHFHEWMDRDDVARELQAKLRRDLIANFNKTALGKKILSQTTMTTGGYGGATKRLTLSPLILALNTLVAEFLYAQNCHYTLSVFCTEVPFRNTLPDFESTRHFRFTSGEIGDILEAIYGNNRFDKSIRVSITKNYSDNATSSLLLLLLKILLERIRLEQSPRRRPSPSARENIKEPVIKESVVPETVPIEVEKPPLPQQDLKSEIYNTNFRYLNKYLIILSKKVNEMMEQFGKLQQAKPPKPRTRMSLKTRKYENLNKSLERVTENLRLMLRAKQKNKSVGAIVEAVNALSNQFSRCAASFEHMSKEQVKINLENKRAPSREKPQPTKTEGHEKSYTDWIQEMRSTPNGMKFLKRVEDALQKAMKRKLQSLEKELEVKLVHHKELLSIQYKQKLLKKLSKHPTSESSDELQKTYVNLERKLEAFEKKYLERLSKSSPTKLKDMGTQTESKQIIENTSAAIQRSKEHSEQPQPTLVAQKINNKYNEVVSSTAKEAQQRVVYVEVEKLVKPVEQPRQTTPLTVDASQQTPPCFQKLNSFIGDPVDTQRRLTEMVKDITEQERNVDHIVYDAKLRIRELENESNQLEQSFLNYLERQKQTKETNRKTAMCLWQNYTKERDQLKEKYGVPRATCKQNCRQNEADDYKVELKKFQATNFSQKIMPPSEVFHEPFEFRNAISEAKEQFFSEERKLKKVAQKKLEFHVEQIEIRDVLCAAFDEELDNPNYHIQLNDMKAHFIQALETPKNCYNTSDSTTTTSLSSNDSVKSSLYKKKSFPRAKRQLFNGDKQLGMAASTAFPSAAFRQYGANVADMQQEPASNSETGNNEKLQQIKHNKQQHAPAVSDASKDNNANVVGTNPNASANPAKTPAPTTSLLQQSMERIKQLFSQAEDEPREAPRNNNPTVEQITARGGDAINKNSAAEQNNSEQQLHSSIELLHKRKPNKSESIDLEPQVLLSDCEAPNDKPSLIKEEAGELRTFRYIDANNSADQLAPNTGSDISDLMIEAQPHRLIRPTKISSGDDASGKGGEVAIEATPTSRRGAGDDVEMFYAEARSDFERRGSSTSISSAEMKLFTGAPHHSESGSDFWQ